MFVVFIYQEIVARAFGLIRMPAMDQTTLISATAANINFMGVTGIEGNILNKEWYTTYFRKNYVDIHPKFRCKITYRFGDCYYEEISKDEAMDRGYHFEDDPAKTLKNQTDLDCYIRDNLNTKIPLDGPQWRCYAQVYKDEV